MKKLTIVAASGILALCAGQALAQGGALQDALVAAETKAWEAWKGGDKAAYSATMSENAVLVNYSDVLKGRDEIAAYDMDNQCTDRNYELLDPEAYELNSSTAALVYDIDYTQTCEEIPTNVIARITATYSKSGSKWTAVMLHEILLSVADEGDDEEEEMDEEDGDDDGGDEEPADDSGR